MNGIFEKDSIKPYLIGFVDEYIFDELSEDYLKKSQMDKILRGVPVPINKKELAELTNLKIAHSMTMIMGCDPNFVHRDAYVEYINKSFGDDFVMPILNEGVEFAANGEFHRACMCFRGVLAIDEENVDALYCYGRACRDAYEHGEGEDYVGTFKAESIRIFELLTMVAPDFDMGYYFLGYGYMNLGLYMKAKLTFEEFLKIAGEAGKDEDESPEKSDMVAEVSEWVDRLKEPVEIESAYNLILSGGFYEGIEALEPYTRQERYKEWWPLYYYLGVAYKNIGDPENSIYNFKRVLDFAPSDISTMRELVEIYQAIGDDESAEKYYNKIKIVERNIEEEKAERNQSYS